MFTFLEGAPPYRPEDAADYERGRWWKGLTFGDLLDLAADMHPRREAFVDRYGRMTYAQARENAERLALGLLDLGIRPLDRVLIQLPNWTEFVTVYFACQKIGAITVMLIDRYRQHEIIRLADISGAVAWVMPVHYGKTDFVAIAEDVRAACPALRHVITVRGEVSAPGYVSLERLLAEHERTPEGLATLAALRPDPRQVAHMGPTGGTTGEPKLVPRTHNSLICAVEYCSKAWDQHCEDINLIVGSIGHDLSFTKGFIGSVLTMGKLVMLDATDAGTVCETIEREQVTSVVWVPTLAQRLLEYEGLAKHNLRSLKKMHSAGGAAFPELVREVCGRLNMRFHNGYGATEGMTCITTAEDSLDTVCTTVGRPTCPRDVYKVVDLEGNTLPVGKQGELVLKGPSVFAGYFRNPEENAKVFDAEGFFKTGDLAIIDDEGYIRLTGRLKEMINRGGESISATMIEALISRHPHVAVVAVVPMPDPVMGERVCAYIQPATGCRLTFEEIITFLRAEKASVQQLPERIEFVEEMPYTGVQKINKAALRADIAAKLEAEARIQQAAGE